MPSSSIGQPKCVRPPDASGSDPRWNFRRELMSSRRTDRRRRRSTSERSSKHQHKTTQLCAQVERALSLTLGGDCTDPTLNSLSVADVTPAPDASRLLVRVIGSASSPDELVEIYDALARSKGLLRAAIAAELNRKRTPQLSFVVVSAEEVE